MTMATVQESLVSETGIPVPLQQIYFGGRPINDTQRTLEELGVHEGEVLALHIRKKPRNQAPAANQQPQAEGAPRSQYTSDDHEAIRLQLLEDSPARNQLQIQHPELAAVVDNPVEFARILREIREREQRERRARQSEIDRLNKEYFDIEAQQKIEEMIRQERVMENLQDAMEHHPEGELNGLSPAVHRLLTSFKFSEECTCFTWMWKLTGTR
ncbi:hypothetical protein BGZ63DRAFT_189324 [Mariannaea sp. PMI_226]|nr:hypothetical protein BGZ63DRAFT_189324 [Mariannaea sp. PMI_226]